MTGRMAGDATSARPVIVIVDIANVMGSRPDGWWKDRAGAATALLARMPDLVGRVADGADGEPVRIEHVVAVLEGAAKAAAEPSGVVRVVRAEADGDGAIVAAADEAQAGGARVLVVTADRGLRARLHADALVAGPGWLNALLGR